MIEMYAPARESNFLAGIKYVPNALKIRYQFQHQIQMKSNSPK